jgi:hypothetical protein
MLINKNFYMKTFIIIIIFLAIYTPSTFGLDLYYHSVDATEILGIDFDSPGGRECLKIINSLVLDDFIEFRKMLLTENPALMDLSAKGGLFQGFSHRILFHWGAGGNIPFNHPPLVEYFEKLKIQGIPNSEIENYKRMIKIEWQKRRNSMINAVEAFFKASGIKSNLAEYLAKPFATLIYDIHLLGDYQGSHINGLQPLEYLLNDIIKTLEIKLFNQGGRFDHIITLLKRLDTSDYQSAAKQIVEILKTHLPTAIESSLGKTLANIIIKGSVLAYKISKLTSSYTNITQKISNPTLRMSVNTAGFVTATSAFFNVYNVLINDSDAEKAIFNIIKDSGATFSSMMISNGIIQIFSNKKCAITVLLKGAESSASLGVGTFVFDLSTAIFDYFKDNINFNEFIMQSRDAAIKGAAVFTTTSCAILLSVTPQGFIITAVAIGTYILTTKAILYYKEYQQSDFLFIEDIYGFLPTEIQRQKAFWTTKDRESIFNFPTRDRSIFDNSGEKSLFNKGTSENFFK